MNQEFKNKEYYQNTFDEVHASEELLRKVKDMKNEDNRKVVRRKIKMRYAVVAAALVAVISSNIVSFAASGTTWVEKVIVKVTVDGEKRDIEMKKSVDEFGNESYEMEVPEGAGSVSMDYEDTLNAK